MTGKERYSNIPASDKLDEVFQKACERGRKKRAYDKMKGIASAAAAIILVFTISNVPVTYAALEAAPVIGSVVRLFHIGEGGVITDATGVHNQTSENALKIWFSQENEYKDNAPYYHVTYKQAPDRVEILLSGVRNFDSNEFVLQAEQLEGVKKAYREVYLDDSAIIMVVELEAGMDYSIQEYKEPAYLELNVFSGNASENADKIFFLRSSEMEMGEGIASLKESYSELEASIARTKSNKYIITIGNYKSEEEAQKALAEISKEGISHIQFTVDSTGPDKNPE